MGTTASTENNMQSSTQAVPQEQKRPATEALEPSAKKKHQQHAEKECEPHAEKKQDSESILQEEKKWPATIATKKQQHHPEKKRVSHATKKHQVTQAQPVSARCWMCIYKAEGSPRAGIIKFVCTCEDKLYCSDCYQSLVLQWHCYPEDDALDDDTKPHPLCLFCNGAKDKYHECYEAYDDCHILRRNNRSNLKCFHCNSLVDRYCFVGAPADVPSLHITFPYGWLYKRPIFAQGDFNAIEELVQKGCLNFYGDVRAIWRDRMYIRRAIRTHTYHRDNDPRKAFRPHLLDSVTIADMAKAVHDNNISQEEYHEREIQGNKEKLLLDDYDMPDWLDDWRESGPIPGCNFVKTQLPLVSWKKHAIPISPCCRCAVYASILDKQVQPNPPIGYIKFLCDCFDDNLYCSERYLYCSECYERHVMIRDRDDDMAPSSFFFHNKKSSIVCPRCKWPVQSFIFAGVPLADMLPMRITFPSGWIHQRPVFEYDALVHSAFRYKYIHRAQIINLKRNMICYKYQSCGTSRLLLMNEKDERNEKTIEEGWKEMVQLKKEFEAIKMPSYLCDWRCNEPIEEDIEDERYLLAVKRTLLAERMELRGLQDCNCSDSSD